MSSNENSRRVKLPRKPDYYREDYTQIIRRTDLGADLMQKAGIKPHKLADGSTGYHVPEWMDAITHLWLIKGSQIPEQAVVSVIRAGIKGDLDAVEMFLFAYE